MDFSPRGRALREPVGGYLDAIVCDPPYGVRAGARKSGSRRAVVRKVPEAHLKDHIPQTQPYSAQDVMGDLLDHLLHSHSARFTAKTKRHRPSRNYPR